MSLNFKRNKSLPAGTRIDVLFAEDHGHLCENSVFAESASGSWHIKESFPVS